MFETIVETFTEVDIEKELACEALTFVCSNKGEYLYLGDCSGCGSLRIVYCTSCVIDFKEKIVYSAKIYDPKCGIYSSITNHRFIRI